MVDKRDFVLVSLKLQDCVFDKTGNGQIVSMVQVNGFVYKCWSDSIEYRAKYHSRLLRSCS